MNVVGRDQLQAFGEKHAETRKWLENWLAEAEAASWATPNDVKQKYASASFIGNNTVISNVKGNDYRMETTVAYKTGVVAVRWLGTHAEYDKRNKQR